MVSTTRYVGHVYLAGRNLTHTAHRKKYYTPSSSSIQVQHCVQYTQAYKK